MKTMNLTVSHSYLFPHCAENNFKVKVKSTAFNHVSDCTYSRAKRARGLELLSPVSFATVEKKNKTQTDE